MRKYVRFVAALALAAVMGTAVHAANYIETGYANDPYAAQIAYDAFNLSVRKRMEAVRLGSFGRSFASAPILRSDDAYGMAPSSRYSNVSGRRQLDCVYYNGFTVWGDLYTTWASQSNKGGNFGYKYHGTGPAIGFDWSTGAFTFGLATTYNWGKLKTKSIGHDQKVRTWALEAYAQYDTEMFYANATLGYGYNRYKGTRTDNNPLAGSLVGGGPVGHNAKYHSNSWNADVEFGMKFNFGGFAVTPHVGLRYFHDRRNEIGESSIWNLYNVRAGRESYHVLELPIGVNLGYAINAGGALIVPQLRFAWIPEIARRRGHVSGSYLSDGGWLPTRPNAPKRGRNAFQIGAGVEAKITRSISAHLDYNVVMRSKAYAHHLNMGLGFTF